MTTLIGMKQAGGSRVTRLLRFVHAATNFFPFFLPLSLSLPLYSLPPLCVTLAVWLGTHSTDEAGLELKDAPVSRELGLKACATMLGCCCF